MDVENYFMQIESKHLTVLTVGINNQSNSE